MKINLALQGGGAHGAFTWGVLDRLLEDDGISFGWISAASAGAVNAVALAAGLAEGSREAADLVTLAAESPVHDTLLVMVSPRTNDELPTTARDIANHTNRLTFNAPLIRDIEIIAAVRETAGSIMPKGRLAGLSRHRFHIIDGGEITGALSVESSIKPDWNMMTYLHGAGRDHASKWLTASRADVGRNETVDLVRHFFPGIAGAAASNAIAAGPRGPAKKTATGKRA